MSRFRAALTVFVLLWLIVPLPLQAQSETPAVANKRLFDRTIDELNFRTMETVYDKSFTRNKFPVTLRTVQARRQFDNFGTNTGLKKLFNNYNDLSERFKGRFGKGPTDLAEFEKQLNGILLDKNFEFFIKGLPRDERVALIHDEQRIIKRAVAQFNASEDPTSPEQLGAVPPADADAEPPVTAPLEDATPLEEATITSEPTTVVSRETPAPAVRHDWLDYLTLLLAGTSTVLLLYLLTSVLPDLRARLDHLASDSDFDPSAPSSTNRPTALAPDRYDDEEENN